MAPTFSLSMSRPEDVGNDRDQRPQEGRAMSRIIREPHLDLGNARAQRSTHDAAPTESPYAFPREENAAAGGDETEGRVESIALMDHRWFKAGLVAHLHERVVVAGSETPREQEEALAAE